MPSDKDMIETRYNYLYIHNVMGSFFADTMEYFTTYLHPRFEYRVIGTYDKVVETLSKQEQYGRETDKPMLPALILNPTGEFGPAEAIAGGKQLWRFPNLAPGFVKRLFEPIYQDQNVIVNVGFMRVKGEIELIMLLNSFYEYSDLRMYMFQIFGGPDRWIYPRWFTSFIILPEELINYKYRNEYEKVSYKLNWDSAGATRRLVKTTNINELVVPCNIKPMYRLTSISDGSTRYGGTDKLADWRLTSTIEYEVELPSFLVLESDYLTVGFDFEIEYGSCFSEYSDFRPPVNRELYNISWDMGIDETSNTEFDSINFDTTSDVVFRGTATFRTRYFHVITKLESKSTSNVEITIPEQITNEKLLIVNSRYGQLMYGDDYILKDNGFTLVIKVSNVRLVKGMIIELYVYRLEGVI